MKKLKNKISIQKIISAIMLVVVLSFTIPKPVHADDEDGIGGKLLKPLVQLVASIGDIAEGLMNHFMLGTENLVDSVMLDKDDPNVNSGSLAVPSDGKYVLKKVTEPLTGFMWADWKLPNMLYSPENIFGNKIAALDINFINPHEYNAIQQNLSDSESDSDATQNRESIATSLQNVVSTWYKAFRNIAIVGLLSVLIYIGIRILIESSAQEKAKYKEKLNDWLVALCLIFVMQYIMSATLMVSEKITQLFANSGSTDVVIDVSALDDSGLGTDGNLTQFKTNLMGYMRFMAQRDNLGDATAYTIIYVALVIFTIMFTVIYLKRVLYMAFFTMISPLVALTYPMDKIADSKAQGFNMWFKEYMMNVILQPVHLVLYTALISSSASLAVDNPIYALVAIGFLLPAEKFIKKMFRLDRADSTSSLGAFAGGALAMTGLKKLGNIGAKGSKGGSGASSGNQSNDKIRMQPIKNDRKNLNEWKNEDETIEETPVSNVDKTMKEGETQQQYEARTGDKQYHSSTESLDNVESPQEAEDNRTLGQWWNEDMGMRTPSQFFNDMGTGIKDTAVELKDATLAKAASIGSKVPIINKIPEKLDKIPAPVKNAAKGIPKTAIRGVKNLGKGVWKNKGKIARTGVRIAGGVMGATIGAGAALTTGDPSKMAQFTVAGVLAGRAVGNSAANLTGRGVDLGKGAINQAGKVKNAYIEEVYGYEAARQKEMEAYNKQAKKAFMKNEQEIAKYKEVATKLQKADKADRKYDVKEVMSAAWNYKESGVTDDKLIENGLKMEAKYNGKIGQENSEHGKMINVVQEVSKFSTDYIYDKDKREALESRLKAKVGEKNGQKVMERIAEAHGEKEFYDKVKMQKPTPKPKPTNNP